MPLQKFWRRLFHPEVEFQVLKSHSAVELTCYSTAVPSSANVPILTQQRRQGYQKSKKNAKGLRSSSVGRDSFDQTSRCGRAKQLNQIPRYYSQYESFGCSPPLAQTAILDDALAVIESQAGGTRESQNPSFSPFTPPAATQQEKTCVVFCFIETKSNVGVLSTTKSLGPDELAAALLAEDEKPVGPAVDENLRVAMTLSQRYSRQDGFKEGLLMKTVESECIHPFVAYASFVASDGQSRVELARIVSRLNRKSAQDFKYRQQQGAYEELYSIVRKREPFQHRLPSSQQAGYIVIGYKLLTLDNLDRLESTWMQWSGASDIARHAPKQWRMKRITFHRQIFTLNNGSGGLIPAPDGFMYVLLCEFENLMDHSQIVMGCDLVERLRNRNCGHVGIYRVHCVYADQRTNRGGVPASVSLDETVKDEGTRMEEYCNCQLNKDAPKSDLLLQLSPVF